MDYFKFIAYDFDGKPRVVLRSSEVSLPELLDDFAWFLRGVGFTINGTIEVVNDDD